MNPDLHDHIDRIIECEFDSSISLVDRLLYFNEGAPVAEVKAYGYSGRILIDVFYYKFKLAETN